MRINGRLFRALVGGGWILFLLLVPGIVQSQGGRLDDDPARLVRLQTADVILRSGVYDTAGNRHVVLQLGHNLKRAEIDSLSAAGVRLVSYLGDGAFIAGVDPNALTADICGVYDIEAAAPWRAENKATPKLRQGVAPDWALSEGGLLKLSVLFFEDVARSERVHSWPPCRVIRVAASTLALGNRDRAVQGTCTFAGARHLRG